MNTILIKILAMGLALAQVTTNPETVKTEFDPDKDQAEVVRLLGEGCAHIRKVFDIEAINLDDLIATAMDDPGAVSGRIEALRGLKLDDLFAVYRQYCQNAPVNESPVDIKGLISFYNAELRDLPDHSKLKEQAMQTLTVVLDQKGERFADIGEPSHRRSWVPLSDIPELAQKAFVAAEDKRFFQHAGVDERGMIRAMVGNLAEPGRPQGGSTITQQVAKNLLVGSGVTFERKIREIVLASRLERAYSKADILEIYLNSIYFGRGAWGIEMAARSYFNKPAKDLTLSEGAMLAALIKGPAYFNPDRYPERVRGRLSYVLQRMAEDGVITQAQMQQALAQTVALAAPRRRDAGFHFVDYVAREADELAGIDSLAESAYTVRSTVHPDLQLAIETSLQEGLARFERQSGRLKFEGPEANLSDAIQKIESNRAPRVDKPDADAAKDGGPKEAKEAETPTWLLAFKQARLPLYDVHWTPAVVVEGVGDRRGNGLAVGLIDGSVVPLKLPSQGIARSLKLYDVLLTRINSSKKGKVWSAELRVRPTVQGAAVVLDSKTGRILAMAGGFSYPLSQLNRTTQAWRQPGSALKPVTYLAALKAGMRPASPVMDTAITLAPITGSRDYWTPRNYSRNASGQITLQQALERSRNLATVHLLDGGIATTPKESLDRVCELALEANLYAVCEPFYPFVLGAQPLRVIDLAAFYAAIANEGLLPTPYAIESISQDGKVVYSHTQATSSLAGINAASFYELKTMLQGVIMRGTAQSIRPLAPYVAGKTGTSNDAADTWFVGFSNDVTVAVWVGYDNADGQRRSLGEGATGNRVAAPIFESIMQAVWTDYAPRAPLAPPSREVKLQLASLDAEGLPARSWKQDRQQESSKARKGKSRAVVKRPQRTIVAQNRKSRPERGGRGIFGGFFENIWGDRLR